MPDAAPLRILTVCAANICRSPYAAARLTALLEAQGSDRVQVSSAGIVARFGDPACRFMVGAAEPDVRGALLRHTSRPLTAPVLTAADLVLVADSETLEQVRRLPAATGKAITTLRSAARHTGRTMETGTSRNGEAGLAAVLQTWAEDLGGDPSMSVEGAGTGPRPWDIPDAHTDPTVRHTDVLQQLERSTDEIAQALRQAGLAAN